MALQALAPSPARRWRALCGGVGLFLLLFAVVTRAVLRATDGHLVYALDDAYIHMSIAKHLALDGVWGIDAHSFASASSSPLWTVLLGLVFRLTGVHDAAPLVLNLAAAAALLVLLDRILDREGFSVAESTATIVAVMLFAPMVPMIWIGMEHSLNNVLVLGVACVAVHVARTTPETANATSASGLLLLMLLTSATRLEGLFVAAGCALLLIVSGRWAMAAGCLGASALPVTTTGLWNMSHGWFFLPSSVLMKQQVLPVGHQSWVTPLLMGLSRIDPPPVFMGLLVAALALLGTRLWRVRAVGPDGMLVVFVVAAALHLSLARFGYLYRYESYLMVLGVVAVATALHHRSAAIARVPRVLAARDLLVVAAIVAVLAGGERTIGSAPALVRTAGHIYRQHRQMARFVATYYAGRAVALNDIGAISYGSTARIYDLAGLASIEVATARRAGTFDAGFINRLLETGDVPIAIVYNAWFPGSQQFYASWFDAGRWVTDEQDVLTEGAVNFYARTADEARLLQRNLAEFSTTLPHGAIYEARALN